MTWSRAGADQRTPDRGSSAVGSQIPSAPARPAALRDTSGPSPWATVTRPASFQSMTPAPSRYRSVPVISPAALAAQTKPWWGSSTWRARNGSQRPTLMLPRMASRAEVARGVPGATAMARWRRTGSGSPSSSAGSNRSGPAGRSTRAARPVAIVVPMAAVSPAGRVSEGPNGPSWPGPARPPRR